MRTPFLSFTFMALGLWACNNGTTGSSVSGDSNTATVKDSAGLIRDSVTVAENFAVSPGDTAFFGFYQGMLPCKDCQGIRHTLLLKDSARFKLEEFILGKDMFPRKSEGRWRRSGDSIQLFANNELLATYHRKQDTLRLAYREGNPVADSIVNKYWIAKHPDAAMNAGWQSKRQAGIDFYGIGNEPFWNIEIDSGKFISFRIADLPKPIRVSAVQPRITKDSTTYSINTAETKMEVVIYNEFCNDGMSDNLYEYRVHVRYKGETFKGCGVYFKVKS